ncbi:MAG: VWA domain-containing protein, partial [Acidobacteriaceae bacterium]|nr:VWA domain-containing protein [Acidobacteriaceae bacterium]
MLLFTFLLTFVLLPVIGLAIDGSITYWMKARLSAAVDASALATARGLSVGENLTSQTANAIATGDSYFNANFPPGVMGTSVQNAGGEPTITISTGTLNTLVATVSASVNVPLYFLRIMGFKNATLAATGTATRRVTNVILVIDRSYSMQQAGACGTMIASAQNFVNDFVDGRDTLGLISFQATPNLDFAPNLYFKSTSPNLTSVLGTAVCTGYTNTSSALNLAYQEIKAINQPLALNVIVLFTDGNADSFTATFPWTNIKTLTDTRYDWLSNPANLVSTPKSSCNWWDTLTGVV